MTTELHYKIQELVDAVKAHALAHYEADGWDFVLETMTDQEIAEEFGDACTAEIAIDRVGRTAQLLDERRREVRAEIF